MLHKSDVFRRWIANATVVLLPLIGGLSPIDAAQAKQVIRVCAVLPLTGPNAAIGNGLMNSMDLAVKQINASGRLGELELQLLRLDDASTPSVGVNAVLRAAADPDVLVCSAHYNSPVALATNAIFHQNGLANVVGTAINWRITEEQKGDEIFRIDPPDTWQMRLASRLPVDALNKQTMFLIDDNTIFGKSLVESMKRYGTEAGLKIVGSDSIAVGEKDFTAVLTKAKSLRPDVIFFGGITTEAALLRIQMRRLQMDSVFYGTAGILSSTFTKVAGKAAEGTQASFFGMPYSAYPGGAKFLADYSKAGYDKPAETFGIWGYANIQVIAEAVKRAAAQGKPTRRGIIEQLKKGNFDTVVGSVSFDKTGDRKESQRVLAYYEVRGGRWVMVYQSDPQGKIVKLAKPIPWEF